MFDIKTIKPNTEILEILELLKYTTFKVKNGKLKTLRNTNLVFVSPIEYIITYPINITIYEYKVNEINNKNFYIKEYKQKYSFKEIKDILGCKNSFK